MLNLPINSKVCENTIFHSGNHKSVGNPHNQYVSKFLKKHTAMNEDRVGVFAKIAHIEWTPNAALGLLYEFEINDIRSTTATVLCRLAIYNTDLTEFTSEMSDAFETYVNFDGTNHTCDVYVKLKRNYRPAYYQLTRAITSMEYFNNHHDDNYALDCVTLYDNAALIDNVTYTDSPIYTDLNYKDVIISNRSDATCKLKAKGRTVQFTCSWPVKQDLPSGQWHILISRGNFPEALRPIDTIELITVSNNNIPVHVSIKDSGEVVVNPLSTIAANAGNIFFNVTWVK